MKSRIEAIGRLHRGSAATSGRAGPFSTPRALIVEHGVVGLTLREIARRVDYSPAGIYEYFASLSEIVAALREEGFTLFGTYLGRVPATLPPLERMVELGMAYLAFAQEYPEEFQLIFTSVSSELLTSEQLRKRSPTFGVVVQAVADVIAAGVFTPREGYGLEEMAYQGWATVHGLAMLRVHHLRDATQELDRVQHRILTEMVRTLAS
ncbi:MAG: TetR/AcrR family transcriptional regulator [Ktedonobacterales bacterium]